MFGKRMFSRIKRKLIIFWFGTFKSRYWRCKICGELEPIDHLSAKEFFHKIHHLTDGFYSELFYLNQEDLLNELEFRCEASRVSEERYVLNLVHDAIYWSGPKKESQVIILKALQDRTGYDRIRKLLVDNGYILFPVPK